VLNRFVEVIRQRRLLFFFWLGLPCALAAARPALGTAAEEPALEVVLARAGRAVGLFWRQLSSVTCTEAITQEKIAKPGKVELRQNSQFDYLILIKIKGDDVAVEESRLARKGKGKSKDLPLLTTSGFQTLALIFHPAYRDSFRFRMDGEPLNAKLVQVRFEHIPGTRSTSALALGGRVIPLDMQGSAWIDYETGVIQRVVAELKAPMDALNLRALYTRVDYLPQRFSTTAEALWLPSRATVDVETAQQHWRNVHSYSDYRRFSVRSEEVVAK
jgi:hypothetical protein